MPKGNVIVQKSFFPKQLLPDYVSPINQVTLKLLNHYGHMSYNYSCPPLSMGDTFQDLQCTPETTNSTKLYIHYVFPKDTYP